MLRIPGTQNVKDPANPKNVTIRSFTNHRYNPSEFRDYLNDLAIPDEDEKARAVLADEVPVFDHRSLPDVFALTALCATILRTAI